MIDFIFQVLVKMGYTHPLHPPHYSSARGLGCGRPHLCVRGLAVSAHHSSVIVLRPNYSSCIHLCLPHNILRICCSCPEYFLFYSLSDSSMDVKQEENSKAPWQFMLFAFCASQAWGIMAASSLLEEKPVPPTEAVKRFQAGEKLFAMNCSGYHSHKSDIFNSPQFPANFSAFLGFLRNPVGPGGTPNKMPPFPADRVSDDEGLKLYQYLVTLRAITVLNPSEK